MCRIAGFISPENKPAEFYDTVQTMCDLQAHGGPDDSGMFQNESGTVTLGHRRLSIVDTSAAGHQPMTYADRF